MDSFFDSLKHFGAPSGCPASDRLKEAFKTIALTSGKDLAWVQKETDALKALETVAISFKNLHPPGFFGRLETSCLLDANGVCTTLLPAGLQEQTSCKERLQTAISKALPKSASDNDNASLAKFIADNMVLSDVNIKVDWVRVGLCAAVLLLVLLLLLRSGGSRSYDRGDGRINYD